MTYRYCPECGAEYVSDFDSCADCLVPLVDVDPTGGGSESESSFPTQIPDLNRLEIVWVGGRRIEAEIARSYLEAQEIDAYIWSSGLAPWTVAAALTEVTGLPNDFNAHRVMVTEPDAPEARRLLEPMRAKTDGYQLDQGDQVERSRSTVPASRSFMSIFRARWALTAFAIFLLLFVLFYGPEVW
jgi:hypothetical protein